MRRRDLIAGLVLASLGTPALAAVKQISILHSGFPNRTPINLLIEALREAATRQRLTTLDQHPRSPFVFTSERGSPFTTAGFARMVERAGVEAKLGFKAHPHMQRLRPRQQGP
jgi:transposase InsO family protein